MTLNLRVRTQTSSFHFSDGRKTVDHVPVDEHCKKIIRNPNFLLSLSGVLDDNGNPPSFDVFSRLNTDLKYKPDYLYFRQEIFGLIFDEYEKDKISWPKPLEILVSYKNPDNSLVYETLKVLHKKCNAVLYLRNGFVHPVLVESELNQNKNLKLFRPNFRASQGLVNMLVEPDYNIDFNHLYSEGKGMPYDVKNLIPSLFMSAFFDVKNMLLTASTLNGSSLADLILIGQLFYQKFNGYKPDIHIGDFEDVRQL